MKNKSARVFQEKRVLNWDSFVKVVRSKGFGWAFRGQRCDWHLETSLERACKDADVPLKIALGLETQLVRDFRRKYDGDDRSLVVKDTLYCLALMQHHGAPTRLLDWTYSSFVAAYFGLEAAKKECVVWCIDGMWCAKAGRSKFPELNERDADETRNDFSWRKSFNSANKFVYPENPLLLNRRLIIHQGLFLCPGDVSVSFEDNLKAMPGWNDDRKIIKLKLVFSKGAHRRAMEELLRMNISRASLFPGLDGFAQSLGHMMPLYERLARRRTGESKPNK